MYLIPLCITYIYSLLLLMVYIFNSKKIFECVSVIFIIPISGKRKIFSKIRTKVSVIVVFKLMC
jgi:hypothetical protein